MWRARVGISCAAHVRDKIPTLHLHAFAKVVGISVEVRIVVAIRLSRVELIDCDPTRLTEEELLDRPIGHGPHRRAPGCHDVSGLMLPRTAATALIERVLNIAQ